MVDFLNQVQNAVTGTEWEEIPVDIDTFVKSEDFLNLPPLSDYQSQILRASTQIYKEETLIALYGKEQGRKRFEETFTEIILALGKGCSTIDSELYDANTGRWTRFDECLKNDNRVAYLSKDGKVETGYATEVFLNSYGPVLEIETNKGVVHKVGEDHKFIQKDMTSIDARDLAVGDYIAAPSKLDVESSVSMDEREVKLIGYWLGDGCMPKDGSPWINMDFSLNDKKALVEYLKIHESFGESPYVRHYKNKNMVTVISRRKPCPNVYAIAEKHGMINARADNKRIPKAIWSLPESQVGMFISRLWGTDGTVYWKGHGAKASRPTLEYCSISEGLAKDIQKILLRIGVVATLRSRIPTYTYEGKKKQGQRAWYLTASDREGFVRFSTQANMLDKDLSEGNEFYKDRGSQAAYDGDIYWHKIKSIKEVGSEELFTPTAVDNENYVANLLLNGNSGK